MEILVACDSAGIAKTIRIGTAQIVMGNHQITTENHQLSNFAMKHQISNLAIKDGTAPQL
jgi:hypothetical protein